MTDTFFTAPITAILLQALFGLAVGSLLGLAHFGMLWWNVGFFASGGLPKAFALQLLRFGVLAAVLYGVAQFGALALLCAALGILIARSIILRRMRSL